MYRFFVGMSTRRLKELCVYMYVYIYIYIYIERERERERERESVRKRETGKEMLVNISYVMVKIIYKER
jgi:hypothetical protein